MEKKWNLQDIKPNTERRRTSAPRTAPAEAERSTPPISERRAPKERPSSKKRSFVLPIVILLILLVGGFVFTIFTSGAEVTVYPRFREPNVNAVFEAQSQAAAGDLAYEVLSLEATGEREVTATGQEDVNEKATGVITIYNKTSKAETLKINTRFQTESGLIYRINDAVSIPATGSVKAEVTADDVGSNYNLPAGQKFTVPGYKEGGLTELYESIYAENQIDISGGYSGPKFIIDDDQLKVATGSLHQELMTALNDRLKNEKPAGFTLFNSAVTFVFQDLTPEELGNNSVKIKQKAILQVPIFKNGDFSSFIAKSTIPGYENEPVRINDLDSLKFEYSTSTENLNSQESISFKLIGKPLLIWIYDGEQLKKDLAGGAQTSLNTVLGGYPAIEKATATIRPFWKRSFPKDDSKITIIEKINKTE